MASNCEQIWRRRTISIHVDKFCSERRCSYTTVTAVNPDPSMTAVMASGGQKSFRSVTSACGNIHNRANPMILADTSCGEQNSRRDGGPERLAACRPWPENDERQIGSKNHR